MPERASDIFIFQLINNNNSSIYGLSIYTTIRGLRVLIILRKGKKKKKTNLRAGGPGPYIYRNNMLLVLAESIFLHGVDFFPRSRLKNITRAKN